MWLKNPNGVYLKLHARRPGLAMSLGADGMVIQLGSYTICIRRYSSTNARCVTSEPQQRSPASVREEQRMQLQPMPSHIARGYLRPGARPRIDRFRELQSSALGSGIDPKRCRNWIAPLQCECASFRRNLAERFKRGETPEERPLARF